ncbi:hypothetical protein [Neobacillus ginsengisoli]|uniref:Uncharacterized protein n=1 Tax=Neobacillus ginsengisoli TaxID=904295 RepID=A0ABT9XXU0_9BACI|nr:hypothetical protein [Neobacillus ginsengisoli]MDQ0200319.1 hypothetical protein [Neobacillus ginsengisoli]
MAVSAKALASSIPIWANEDAAASDKLVRQADGVSYTVGSDVKNKTVVFHRGLKYRTKRN